MTILANIFAIDIGGTYIKYGLVHHTGKMVEQAKIETPTSLEQLTTFVEEQTTKQSSLAGIAISSPGSVATDGVIYGSSAIPYLHGPNIKQLFETATRLPVTIENDANCAALAEVWQGSAKYQQDIAVVVIGTGIGGALIKDGMIDKGSNLHGGEFGYMILDPHALGSGMSTFSELASSFSIIKRVAMKKNIEISTLTGEEIFQLAKKGDAICQGAIDDFYRMLAVGIYNIQYAYDPELILLGGGISERSDLIERLEYELNDIVNQIDVATIVPKIDTCYFSGQANMIGAVYHFIQQEKHS